MCGGMAMGGRKTRASKKTRTFKQIADDLSKIELSYATLDKAEELRRELSNVSVEKLFRPFTI